MTASSTTMKEVVPVIAGSNVTSPDGTEWIVAGVNHFGAWLARPDGGAPELWILTENFGLYPTAEDKATDATAAEALAAIAPPEATPEAPVVPQEATPAVEAPEVPAALVVPQEVA